MTEDGGASSLEESKCLAGIFQQIVNDCKVSLFSLFLDGFLTFCFLFVFHQDVTCSLGAAEVVLCISKVASILPFLSSEFCVGFELMDNNFSDCNVTSTTGRINLYTQGQGQNPKHGGDNNKIKKALTKNNRATICPHKGRAKTLNTAVTTTKLKKH